MKHHLLITALLLSLTATAHAQNDDTPTPFLTGAIKPQPVIPAEQFLGPTEPGFTYIFNGQNLDGWIGNTEGTGYKIDREAGRLICTGQNSGNLLTEKQYDNFILRFEFKLWKGSNSGLAIRSPNQQGSLAYEGMELQILHDEHPKYHDPNYDGFELILQPWQYHGSLYGIAPATPGSVRPPGRWNNQEVIVNGRDIKITLNDNVILDINIDEAMKDGTLDGHEHPGALRNTGYLGFLGHSDYIEFRNLRIKELPSSDNEN